MTRKKMTRLGALLALATLFVGPPAWADIDGVTVSPAATTIKFTASLGSDGTPSTSLPILSPSSTLVSWTLICNITPNNAFPTVSNGSFTLDGQEIASNTGALVHTTGPFSCADIQTNPKYVDRETLLIPKAVTDAVIEKARQSPQFLARAKHLTASSPIPVLVSYTRGFADPQGGGTPPPREIVPATLRITFSVSLNTSFLDSVSATAPPTLAPLTRGASTRVAASWTPVVRRIGTGTPLTISSGALVIRTPSGVVLRTIPTRLSRSGVTGGPVPFTESIQITGQLALEASKKHRTNVLILARTFTDGVNSIEETISVGLGTTGVLNLSRLELYFTEPGREGERFRFVNVGHAFNVLADINFVGSGLFRGQFDISRPLRNPEGPTIFSPLPGGLVAKFLGGYPREKLTSPRLPTDEEGFRRVRFTILDPKDGFREDSVELVYYVGPEPPEGYQHLVSRRPGKLGKIKLIVPAPGAEVGPDLRFGWQAVSGITLYRLEIFDNEELKGKPITGQLVKGDQVATGLSQIARSNLVRGQTYWARIVGLDANGVPRAATDPRSVSVP